MALVAVANGALLTMIMSSRLAYGMASDGLLPKVLTKVLPKRQTPWVAIIVTTALSIVLALTGWAPCARVSRSVAMSVRERQFVLGLRAAGASEACRAGIAG